MPKIYNNNKSVAHRLTQFVYGYMGGRTAQLCGRGQKFRTPLACNFFDFLGPGIIGRSAPPLHTSHSSTVDDEKGIF